MKILGLNLPSLFAPQKRKDGKSYLPAEFSGLNGFIDLDGALQVSTVYACMSILTKKVAMLPVMVQEFDGQNWIDKPYHPLMWVLAHRPNSDQTAFQFFSFLMKSLLQWGNAYVVVSRTPQGEVVGLRALNPKYLNFYFDPNTLKTTYIYTISAGITYFRQDQIMHFSDLSDDGRFGISRLQKATLALNAALLAQKGVALYFSNASKLNMYAVYDAGIGEEEVINLRDKVNKAVQIADSSLMWVPKNDAEFKTLTADSNALGVDAQKFQREQICAFFEVPPNMVADMEKSSYSSIEAQSLNFVRLTIQPWVSMVESVLMFKLLQPWEVGRIRIKFNTTVLTRGTDNDIANVASKLFLSGIVTQNEARDLVNKTHLEDGNKCFMPVNMQEQNDTNLPNPSSQRPV